MLLLCNILREELGEDVDLLIECHGRFNTPYAIKAAKGIEQYDSLYVPKMGLDCFALIRSFSALDAQLSKHERMKAIMSEDSSSNAAYFNPMWPPEKSALRYAGEPVFSSLA